MVDLLKLGKDRPLIYLGSDLVKHVYLNKYVYSLEETVTYVVDTDVTYTETFRFGDSILSPTSFTPTKSGWTFVGWKENTDANGSILTSTTLSTEPVTLYAVFKQDVTCTFNSYNNSQNVTGTRWYNNGNTVNASITIPTGTDYSGWSWRGWSASGDTTANATVAYANGDTITDLTTSNTYYGLYSATVTITYNANGGSGSVSTSTGTKYWNAYGNTLGATISLRSNGFSRSDYSFNGWSLNGTTYSAGASVTLTANATCSAIWKRNAVSKTLKSGTGSVRSTTTFDTTGFSDVEVTLEITSAYGYGWLAQGSTNFSGEAYHFRAYNETNSKTIDLTPNSGTKTISYEVEYDRGYGGSSSNTSWKLKVKAK